ncbi:MAG: hypothetical protein ACLUHE_10250 [Christensenellales bacterium]
MGIKPVKIPGVGMRNVKTALAAAFCALAYYFVGRSPAFACIGAIFGMGSDMEDLPQERRKSSVRHADRRSAGHGAVPSCT